MQQFNIELDAPSTPLVLYAMQADSLSRFFQMTITQGGTPWTPPDGAAWTVRFGAPEMPAGWYDTITEVGGNTHTAVTFVGNTATVEIAEQAVSSPGKNVLCVLVTDATGYQIASWEFQLLVTAVPGMDAPEATVYYNALTGQVAESLANAQAAAASATLAQSWAVGGTGSRTGEDTNNAEYWSQQSAQSAQQAVGFRTMQGGAVLPINGDVDLTQPYPTETDASVTITSAANRINSVNVNGYTTQTGSGSPSPTNIRPIENAGADGTTFVDVNGEQTQVTLQAPLHEGDTLQTNVLYQGAQKCVETHTRSAKVLTGSENLTATTVSERTYFALPLTNVAKPASGADVTEAVSNALQAASQNTMLVNAYSFCISGAGNLLCYFDTSITTVQQAQSLLSSLYSAGTPLTVEYPLEQPEVYAADPVQISNPAGTYTVSGESGTTCQVYMKPVQDGGDASTLNGHSWSDIPTLKLAEYTYPQQEIQANARIEFEASFSAVGIPDSANVASIQVLSTGWGGVVPQAWYAATSAKTINLDLYNATSAAHTVAPQIVVMYF